MKVLGIDPGHSTGWCVIGVNEKTPSLLMIGTCKDPTLEELEGYFKTVDYVVCEDFLVQPGKAMAGAFNNSRMLTIQVIGAVQLLARLNQVPVILQQNNIKPVGYGYSNLKYVKGAKGMHVQDSIAHAMFFLVKGKHCSPLRDKPVV